MCPRPRIIARIDDITLWQMPEGRVKAAGPDRPLHRPHSLWLLAPRGGAVSLVDEAIVCECDPVLLSPMRPQVIALRGYPLAVELPSYRLGVSPLDKQPFRLYGPEQGHLIQAMLEELTLTAARLEAESQRYLAQAIGDLLWYHPEPAALPDTLLSRADALMRQRFREPALRAEDIIAALEMSRAGLYRLLSPYGGFKVCLHALRLDRVARLLRNPQQDRLAIKGLLFQNGFSSTEQFQRLFLRRFGVPARAFRKGTASPALGSWQFSSPPQAPAPP